ncbi:MAG: HAMP domain-containing protein [Candidatus Binatia bacterium]
MGRRSLLAVLLIPLGCLSLGLILFLATDRSSLTLADLAPGDSSQAWRANFLRSAQSLGEISAADWILIVYLLVGSIVALIALRFIVSAVRVAKADRLANAADDPLSKESTTAADLNVNRVSPARSLGKVAPPQAADDFKPAAENRAKDHARPKEHFFVEIRDHFRTYAHGLTGKIIITFTATVAGFGLLIAAVVYWTLSASLWGQAIERAKIIAVNVSDTAPVYILARNANTARELLRRLSIRPGIAYLLILDREGRIFADSFPVLPDEVAKPASANLSIDQSDRTFRLGKGMVYEVAAPVLEGRLGAVRVGFWQEDVNMAIREVLTPLIAWIALIIAGGIVAAFFLAWTINRPIVRLLRAARDISHGELDSPGADIADTGEYGEISRALERMRSSVRAAMIRLSGEY